MDKIVRVEAFPLQYPEPNNDNKIRYVTLARIETSDGIVGWGECISQWPEASLAVKTIIDAGFAKLLIGEDGTQAAARRTTGGAGISARASSVDQQPRQGCD